MQKYVIDVSVSEFSCTFAGTELTLLSLGDLPTNDEEYNLEFEPQEHKLFPRHTFYSELLYDYCCQFTDFPRGLRKWKLQAWNEHLC